MELNQSEHEDDQGSVNDDNADFQAFDAMFASIEDPEPIDDDKDLNVTRFASSMSNTTNTHHSDDVQPDFRLGDGI